MVSPSHQTRFIGWNGVHLFLPIQWEVIVKGNSHLIMEENHHPLLEVRWQNKTQPPSGQSHTDAILSRLRKELARELLVIESPPFLHPLTSRFTVSAFAYGDSAHPAGAIITCMKRETPILLQFFNTTTSSIPRLSSFFETFTCEFKENGVSRWAIEDLKFDIPRQYDLEASSFSLGLIQLFFKTRATQLKFCRIAHASHHFQEHSFSELFDNFCGDTSINSRLIDEKTLILDTPPSLSDQLLRVVKRKKIYRWAKFDHLDDQDKILGLHLQSRKPLEADQIATIENSYGTI